MPMRSARQDGIAESSITVVSAPAPFDYFKRHQKFLKEGESVVICMVAPQSLDAFLAFTARQGGRVAFNSSELSEEELRACRRLSNLPGTTRRCAACGSIRRSPICRCSIRSRTSWRWSKRCTRMFEGEIIDHLEFVRFDGDITCFGLPMVRYSTEERLEEIMATFTSRRLRRSSIRTATRWKRAA
jgi:hypothetical protein